MTECADLPPQELELCSRYAAEQNGWCRGWTDSDAVDVRVLEAAPRFVEQPQCVVLLVSSTCSVAAPSLDVIH